MPESLTVVSPVTDSSFDPAQSWLAVSLAPPAPCGTTIGWILCENQLAAGQALENGAHTEGWQRPPQKKHTACLDNKEAQWQITLWTHFYTFIPEYKNNTCSLRYWEANIESPKKTRIAPTDYTNGNIKGKTFVPFWMNFQRHAYPHCNKGSIWTQLDFTKIF